MGQVRSAASSAPPRTVRDVRFTDSFKEAGIQDVVILGLKAGGANARGCSRLRCQVFRGAFRSGYAGWRVSADQVEHGIATPGVIALLDLAFTNEPDGLGLHRVQANVMPSNGASARVAEKAGFRLEGRARSTSRSTACGRTTSCMRSSQMSTRLDS